MTFKQVQGIVIVCILVSTSARVLALQLYDRERAWLESHPVIRVAPDPDFAPYESFSPEGTYQGIAADYLRLVEKQLGIRFEIVREESWTAVLNKLRKREVDVIAAMARSPQREEYLLFTQPHIVVPGVVISSKTFSNDEEMLGADKKVAVVAGYVWADLLKNQEVDINIVLVEDTITGLELASLGAVDAVVSDLATATYGIQQAGITNLRIIDSPLGQTLELGMAIRNDWPELRSILDKALGSLSKEERDVITSKWLRLESVSLLDKPEFHYSLLAALGLLILILAWNRTLKSQVDVRTKELKKAQMHLIRAEKMETIGRLAAGVAHEVKNPLAILQMGVEFLRPETGGDKVVTGVLLDMEDAVVRADKVIMGLLDFSRDSKLDMVEADLNMVIEEALSLVGHELRQRNIKLSKKLSPDIPHIKLDKSKLQQVLINLFMNAAHAMHNDGELFVSSKVIRLKDKELLLRDSKREFQHGQDVLQVEVADTGPGIPATDLNRLFDPFFTTKPVGEGTGLGLSVSSNIIQLHNGLIDIRNRKRVGAKVVIVFALNEEKER